MANAKTKMNRFFKDGRTIGRVKQGPLGHYLRLYADHLYARGYPRLSGRRKLQLAADFCRWLNRKNIAAKGILAKHVGDYLQFRKRSGIRLQLGDPAAVVGFLNLLRDHGVTTERIPQPPLTPVQKVLRDYDLYLQKERSLAPATRVGYAPFVRQFLMSRFGSSKVNLSRLNARDVLEFVRRSAGQLKNKRALLMTTALRSFLRFARYRGDLTLDLAACVPPVASWSLSTLPRALPPAQVHQVLEDARKRGSAVGHRDYAILLLLARLGLRGGEVCHLLLEDLDWEKSRIAIRGKGGRVTHLPLPADVGQAIAVYLQQDRPRVTSTRRLFLRVRAPLTGFKSQGSIGSVVKHALQRAKIESSRKGSHQFRHSLASTMLQQGSSLSEIGELLRHRSPDTTAIYAKVDLRSLSSLALPWPGGKS
jgi:site-specific recombinase XerD